MDRRLPGDSVLPPARTPCPPGTFGRLADKLQKRRQRRVFLRTAAAATLVAAAGGGLSIWLVSDSLPEADYGGLTCAEVEKLAPAYARGELSAAVREQVRQHLARCPRCGPRFKAMDLPT